MCDISTVLPTFRTDPFAKLLQSLDHHQITTTDLLTRDAPAISQITFHPILDIRRLSATVLSALHASLRATALPLSALHINSTATSSAFISTLDDELDDALGGGIPVGRLTELTGQSGAGKTQFLLSLLLSVQMTAPRGLGKGALYITTEAPLATTRLAQILQTNYIVRAYNAMAGYHQQVSLDRIASAATPDLESQEHILAYQVPVMVERLNIGLLVVDSVTANYRAEFDRGERQMGVRGTELMRMGGMLRGLAAKYNIAVVVANQVADRFGAITPVGLTQMRIGSSNPGDSTVAVLDNDEQPWGQPPLASVDPLPIPALSLDHQQRFFTGWGDDPSLLGNEGLKTPALGLVWSTQVAVRVALVLKNVLVPVGGGGFAEEDGSEGERRVRSSWRRFMKVVFAPHVKGGRGRGRMVEYEIVAAGVKTVTGGEKQTETVDA